MLDKAHGHVPQLAARLFDSSFSSDIGHSFLMHSPAISLLQHLLFVNYVAWVLDDLATLPDMGNISSFPRHSVCVPNPDHRVLLCGLDNAGKSSLLLRLQRGEIVETTPTDGMLCACPVKLDDQFR